MNEIDGIYTEILTVGLIALREAAYNKDVERCFKEAEHLHNLPSLIGDANVERHIYYFNVERVAFCKWAMDANNAELHELIRLQYLPLWDRLLKALSKMT